MALNYIWIAFFLIAFIVGALAGPMVFEVFNVSIADEVGAIIVGLVLLCAALFAAAAIYRSEKKKQKLKPKISALK